ncbi:MAG: hypothetical protein AAB885_03230, partial [Patescibacteria group bacterium]
MIIGSQDQQKQLSHYFLKGEALKRFFDIIATSVGLVNSFFIIRALSVYQFGLYQLILSFIAIASNFNIVEMLNEVVGVDIRRLISTSQLSMAKRLFWESALLKVGLGLLLAAAIFLGSSIISDSYSQDIGIFIKISSLLLIIRALESSATAFFKSVISFVYWSFPAIREVVKFLLIILAINFYYFDLPELVVIYVITEAVAVFVLVSFSFLWRYRKVFGSVTMTREWIFPGLIKNYGGWLVIRYSVSRITKGVMPWLVKVFINTEAVAFYALAVNLIAFIEGTLPLNGLTPILSLKMEKRSELAYIFKQAMKYAFWLGLVLAVVSVIA